MTHDDQSKLGRRGFLSGIGAVALSGATLNAVGAAATTVIANRASVGVDPPSLLVFDVNGSLLNTDALSPLFKRLFRNPLVAREWYAELVLNANAITMSGAYPGTFFRLGQAVLQMVGGYHNVPITPADNQELLDRLLTMACFPDVPHGLQMLRDAGFRLVALTNSPADPNGAQTQVKNAGIAQFFERVFVTDSVRRYKAAQPVYYMVAEEMGVPPQSCCMISTHHWDNLGAQSVGFSAALMNRPGHHPLPMPGLPPQAAVATDLVGVAQQLIKSWRQ